MGVEIGRKEGRKEGINGNLSSYFVGLLFI
jgi:hypothetical protein